MNNDRIVNNYAKALFEVASSNNASENIKGKLEFFIKILERYPKVRQFLSHPVIDFNNKKYFLYKEIKNKISLIDTKKITITGTPLKNLKNKHLNVLNKYCSSLVLIEKESISINI